jgi:hypothetical protein
MSIDDSTELMNLKFIAQRTGYSTSSLKKYVDMSKEKKQIVDGAWEWLDGLSDRLIISDANCGKTP